MFKPTEEFLRCPINQSFSENDRIKWASSLFGVQYSLKVKLQDIQT